MCWNLSVGPKQAEQQESKLETAQENSQLPDVALLPRLGIHRLVAHICTGKLGPCKGPGHRVLPGIRT